MLLSAQSYCELQSFLGQLVGSGGDQIHGEVGRDSQLCLQVEEGRDHMVAFKARKEKSAENVCSRCQQQGQGEPGGRRLVAGQVGKVVCGVHHRAGDGKGGGKREVVMAGGRFIADAAQEVDAEG